MSIDRLAAFLSGSSDETDWLRAGLKLWLAAGGDLELPRCLRLPARPAGLRRMLRDLQLIEATRHLPPGPAWTKARWLAESIQRFESRLWPCWRSMSEAPSYATPTERALWQARLYGPLPATTRGVYNVLKQKDAALSATDPPN